MCIWGVVNVLIHRYTERSEVSVQYISTLSTGSLLLIEMTRLVEGPFAIWPCRGTGQRLAPARSVLNFVAIKQSFQHGSYFFHENLFHHVGFEVYAMKIQLYVVNLTFSSWKPNLPWWIWLTPSWSPNLPQRKWLSSHGYRINSGEFDFYLMTAK